jgi:toxin ParE1/3/4
MNLYWTEEARQQLQNIRVYISEDSSEIAEEQVSKIIERVETLIKHPAIGHRLKDDSDSDVRELFIRPYRVIYQLVSDQILILTVLHYRQLIPDHFNNLAKIIIRKCLIPFRL